MRVLVPALLVVAAACKQESSAPAPKTTEPAAAAPKQMVYAGDPCAKAKPHGAMAWIEDDYPSAIACAKQKQLPLVLDLWAPWCHTCLSMQTTVFTDKSFEPVAPKFVFAALDTDRDVNAAAVDRYPLSAWPTFYVVSPDEVVLARFVGSASVEQFHAFLDAGATAMAGGGGAPDGKLNEAEKLLAQKKLAEAEAALVAALAAAPPSWPRRPDALVSLISTRAKLKHYDTCIELAEQGIDQTGNTASASDFLAVATECMAEREKAEPDRIKKLRERAVERWQKLVADAEAPLSVDDRSDAMMNLRETLVTLGKKDEAKAIAEKQRALLDETAAKAATPMAAMTYNWPRAEVYVFLGRPLDLVPALEKSAKDLPTEYDPRARLGWIYWKGGKLDEAARWTDEALKLVYGPRKVRVLNQRADIAKAAGDKPTEKRYREEIVKTLEALPPSQVQPDAIAKAKQTVADLDKPATPAAKP
ncbi:MAG TPA: thioredoxin family protein [Kofleriaceae bacterium]|nr:thioredoxin family protein [Kofleriaceae bacterium]